MGKKEEEKKGNMPEKKFRAGGVSATVWKNSGEKDGKEYEFHTVGIERNYKDKEDEWQKTNTMRVNDLPKVVLVAQKAYEYLSIKEEKAE